MGERPADAFGANQRKLNEEEKIRERKQNEKEEKERVGKDKDKFLLKRIKTFYLNGYHKVGSFKGTNRKLRRFSS